MDLPWAGRPRHGTGAWRALLLLPLLLFPGRSAAGNPLEDYVRQPDAHYGWRRTGETKNEWGVTTRLELTSQHWREHTWNHRVVVLRPAAVRQPDTAFLFITGDGDGERQLPSLRLVAERAGILAAVVTQVPNQPLYDGRVEDALIAHTLDQYLKTGDETWPLLFPMVKSAVRAMDAVQSLAAETSGAKVGRFVVSGMSKRGWTTWLAAAVDPRVVAIAPMVIDTLNMKAQLAWAEKIYGRQSEEIDDYTDLNLHQKLDDPPMQRLRSWVDPFAYRARYTLPKLLLLGTNDPYWTVDSLRHYWEDLPEPKLVFQTPNAGHDLAGGKDAWDTVALFVQAVAARKPLPRVTWNRTERQGKVRLEVTCDQPMSSIRLWTADSEDRDFRDAAWTGRALEPGQGGRTAWAEVDPPARGYRAYLAELELRSTTGQSYKLSTEARVTPDTLP